MSKHLANILSSFFEKWSSRLNIIDVRIVSQGTFKCFWVRGRLYSTSSICSGTQQPVSSVIPQHRSQAV